MMKMSARIVQRPDFAKIAKNIDFGTALGLTKTAGQGKDAVMKTAESKFTIRNNWLKSPIGPRVKIAKRDNLKAEISMSAHFGRIHDEGGTKIPFRNWIAVPTKFARPNKRSRIANDLKPAALMDSGRGVIVTLDSGSEMIFAKHPRRKTDEFLPMYVLTKTAKIKDVDIFREPIEKVVDKNLKDNIRAGIAKAISTMR